MTSNTGESPPDGAAALDAMRNAITRYVSLPSEEAVDAVALWTAATHAQPAWAHAPRLVIRAPERRCGKSRLLDVVEATCHAALMTVNASPAAVYRAIGTGNPPTLLIDEADTIFGAKAGDANEDLRGLLNAGHQRNRPAIRWDNATRSLETIPTFAMAALAGIGAMPDTIEDRAVVIRMRRRAPGETVAPYRVRRDGPGLNAIGVRLADWLGSHLPELEAAEPAMPLEDRAADTWEPLVAVADLAGGEWPTRARVAALTLTAEADDTGAGSERIRLLTDCRTAFGDLDKIPTTTLLEHLKSDPEAPWATYGPAGTGLTAMKLGDLLREYDIRSHTLRFPAPVGQAKGYTRADFIDAWERYTPLQNSADGNPRPPLELAKPYQPSQPSQARSAPVRLDQRYGLSRTSLQAVPPLTSDATAGTAGTASPTDTARTS
ncbi:DUF3631 domain-containing protein [Actinocatenispora rupis]|uniref:DUF3631 domain-containing protein n=1 Tax=Actinocatenispora rupis TaxID=519421 RepID=A0A8J3NEW3_9ACTN|nr:DUF3631 domain-containing protein [Actinocatenispora rupis]GID13064.1 hypothetical protein Aru02nite_39530 [Actinocatenispora rupis]